MNLRTRKRLALLLLVVGLPLYIVVAITLVNWADRTFGRLPALAEFALYLALGVVWVLPFRRIFTGIGRPEE